MERLRHETTDLHKFAESRALQQAMAKGRLPRERFAEYLGQLHIVHRALEAALSRGSDRAHAIAAVVQPFHVHSHDLEIDLEHYGLEIFEVSACASTETCVAYIESCADANPVALLGCLYVLEGSMNGNQFIARALGRAYGIESGPGLSYLNPYGQDQRARWMEFKASMNACDFSAGEMDEIVAAAKRTFEGIAAISDELTAFVAVA